MGRENRSRYAILGVLIYGPVSGYDIRKHIETTLGSFWTESFGQIYPILKGLVEEGLATVSADRQESRPERKLYAITEQGLDELRRWLNEPVHWEIHRNELLLKLFFGSQIGPGPMRSHIRDYRERLEAALGRYRVIQMEIESRAGDPDAAYRLATLRYGLYAAEAMLRWCDETLQSLPPEAGQHPAPAP